MKKHLFLPLYFVLTIGALLSMPVHAVPQARLLPFWNQSNELNVSVINHNAWARFLTRYVTKSASGNQVAYSAVHSADKAMLNDYLIYLQSVPIRSYRRDEQFAFWVNLYNAYVVKLILDNYPISSIQKISTGLFTFGPWDEKYLRVEKQLLSLNDIEHGILRPIWRDNRIHYAVNCASIGCPNLALEPYTADKLEMQLQKAQSDYINHPRGFRFKDEVFYLSKIYDWYAEDFTRDTRELIHNFVQILTNTQQKEELTLWLEENPEKISVQYIPYNWQLNKKTKRGK